MKILYTFKINGEIVKEEELIKKMRDSSEDFFDFIDNLNYFSEEEFIVLNGNVFGLKCDYILSPEEAEIEKAKKESMSFLEPAIEAIVKTLITINEVVESVIEKIDEDIDEDEPIN